MSLLALLLLAVAVYQPSVDAVASFNGILKSATKKALVVAVENGETMKMFVTGKTRFIRNGKPAKPADFHDGENVVVEAERDVRLNLLAVQVRTADPPKAAK